jgi:hypothetical protein
MNRWSGCRRSQIELMVGFRRRYVRREGNVRVRFAEKELSRLGEVIKVERWVLGLSVVVRVCSQCGEPGLI